MKNLNLFLTESLSTQKIQSAMNVIRELTIDYIESSNQYSDKELHEIVNGKLEPEYDEICDYILDVWSASDNKPNETIEVLNNREEYKDDIYVSILRGFEDYLDMK